MWKNSGRETAEENIFKVWFGFGFFYGEFMFKNLPDSHGEFVADMTQ